jgi:hypothetical protein
MQTGQRTVNALALVLCAGSVAVAAPVVDGVRSAADAYGAPKWVNNVPTGFGNNFAGAGGSLGNVADVSTGIEMAIPYSAIGYTGGAIKVCAFIAGGGGFVSNQFIAGLPINTNNIGGNETSIDLNTIGQNQFVSATPAAAAAAPTIDGTKDAGYGAAVSLQTNFTQFGNAGNGLPVQASGSELDGLYMIRDDAAQMLYVIFTGNLETNGNRLNIFFDTQAGGQSSVQSGGWLSTYGGSAPGFTFDTGFGADYAFSVNGNVSVPAGAMFVDYADLTGAAGVPNYAGTADYSGTAALTGGDFATAPAWLANLRIAINNSNTGGVGGNPVAVGNSAPNQDFAFGSELAAVYGRVEGDFLYVMLTGNLETTFNKICMFFDATAGGQNRLRGESNLTRSYIGNTTGDFGGLNRMGANELTVADPAEPTNGLKFDADFSADYWLTYTNGVNGGNVENYVNAAVIRTGGRRENANASPMDYNSFDGGAKRGASAEALDFGGPVRNELVIDNPAFDPNQPVGPLNPQVIALDGVKESGYAPRTNADVMVLFPASARVPVAGLLELAMDNSNIAGVTGDGVGVGAEAPENVTTGLEFKIKLSELGYTGGPIKFFAAVTNGGYDFFSNQVVGLSAPQSNLGEPRTLDFSTIAGNQFVVLNQVICGPSDVAGSGQTVGGDGQLTADDIIVFINWFFAADARADVAGSGQTIGADGQFTADDIIVFIGRFFTGC